MKKFIMLAAAILVSSYCFAYTQSSNLTKNSPQMKSLGMAWNAYKTAHPTPGHNDITMVYGGEDISRRPTIAPHLTTA